MFAAACRKLVNVSYVCRGVHLCVRVALTDLALERNGHKVVHAANAELANTHADQEHAGSVERRWPLLRLPTCGLLRTLSGLQ